MRDSDTKAVLRKLLQDHVGRQNAVTQSQLAAALNENPSTLRSELRRLREERGIPIGNMRDGYYVIADREELQEYVGHINSEIESKKRTIKHTLDAFEEFDRDGELGEDDDIETCERCGARIDGDPYEWFSVEICADCYDEKPGTKSRMTEWVNEVQA